MSTRLKYLEYNINYTLPCQCHSRQEISCSCWTEKICSTLDESTAHRQLKSPQSLSGRSIHLNLVTKWSWSWSWMTSFVQCQSTLPFWDTAISKFDHENPWSRSCMRSKVKVTFELKNMAKCICKCKELSKKSRYLNIVNWVIGLNLNCL